jgi:hypothetical protein
LAFDAIHSLSFDVSISHSSDAVASHDSFLCSIDESHGLDEITSSSTFVFIAGP